MKLVWVFLVASLLFFSLAAKIHMTKAESTNPTSYWVVQILSPTNTAYNSRFLILNVTFIFGMGMQYKLKYSIDGRPESDLPWGISSPTELHVLHDAFGWVELPVLTEGTHSVTVILEASGFVTSQNPRRYSGTVCFTIDSTSPKISELSVENKTYSTPDVPLNFTINENTSKIAYSLDGMDNVTIAENTTLTGLSFGAHNLTVYAWDDAGNIGVSKTVNFDITDTTPASLEPSDSFLAALIVATPLTIVTAFAAGVLVYFKKHKV